MCEPLPPRLVAWCSDLSLPSLYYWYSLALNNELKSPTPATSQDQQDVASPEH